MGNQEINVIQKRLKILGDDEIESLYGLPHFTPEERLQFVMSWSDISILLTSMTGKQLINKPD